MRTIKVTIESLILQDIPLTHSQSIHVQEACEAELVHLLTSHGLSPQLSWGGSRRSIPGGTILADMTDSSLLGCEIARAIFQSIGGKIQ